jgi:alginate O-acetyltransferase complex protein AlgI
MLFNSLTFIFAFLPIVWIVFVVVSRAGGHAAVAWVCLASLVFYGYNSLYFLAVLLASVTANFVAARALLRLTSSLGRRALLALIVAGNLLVLGYFKYANFFAENVLNRFGFDFVFDVALPLGISFYTFQKIALMVDIYRSDVKDVRPLDYVFFISFFPQLIAGPIVHYKEVVPQLGAFRRDRNADLVAGLSMFIIGLFKKVVIADSAAVPATRFFDAVAAGAAPGFGDAWFAALCYGLQIYFDFSAYSDMAVGLGRMFGIDLPINFASPYKASSIIEFWRRWHITLSRFLRDYVYIPLGGGRHGAAQRSVNLFATMIIGGAWHGAAWAFVVWGALHGSFLLLNHAWRKTPIAARLQDLRGWRIASQAITLACILFAWVPFRTADLDVAAVIWKAMLSFDGALLPTQYVGPRNAVAAIVLLVATLTLPNSYEIMGRAKLGTPTPGYPATVIARLGRVAWRPTLRWAVLLGALLGLVLVKINDASEFIYFRF